MAKIVATYDSGRVWVCDTNSFATGAVNEVCAISTAVEIIGGSLMFWVQVMHWRNGQWDNPTFGDKYKTPALPLYELLNEKQLTGVVSITVDGILAYNREDNVLVPVVGDTTPISGGMCDDFATLHHPETSTLIAGLTREHPSVCFGS